MRNLRNCDTDVEMAIVKPNECVMKNLRNCDNDVEMEIVVVFIHMLYLYVGKGSLTSYVTAVVLFSYLGRSRKNHSSQASYIISK
jgi:hypothetical protein